MPGDAGGEIPLKDYIDAQIAELRAALGLIEISTKSGGVPLREHIDELFDERDRAKDVAEREREKAALALRDELSRQIEQGDEALRAHISNQIAQIREALVSADKLEAARIDAVSDRLDQLNAAGHAQIEARIVGVQREVMLTHTASERAIQKAETANEKRFESVNEFRNSLSDQTSSFLPREVAETQFAEMRRAIQEMTDKVNKLV